MTKLADALLILNILILAYFIIVNGFYLILILLSYLAIIKHNRLIQFEQWRRVIQSPRSVPISIISPAYNEEVTIVNSVKSLLALQYGSFEVIVVNDGSKDSTLQVLKDAFELHVIPVSIEEKVKCREIMGIYRSPVNRELVVVDKRNGGKADALNAGINVSRYPIFCAIDADSVVESEAFLRITRPFLEKPHTTAAIGGIVRVANGCNIEDGYVRRVDLPKNWLALIQTVEYLRAFLFGRTGLAMLGGLLIISGAFGVFRKSTVIEVGGYANDTVGEDMELVTRLHHLLRKTGQKYEISFIPDSICWSEVPESLKILARQRNRWQRGLMDSLIRHREMFFNLKYGAIGMIVFPYFFLFEMLGPVVELLGYIIVPLSFAFGQLNIQFFLLFLSLAILLGVVISTASVVLDELSFKRYPDIHDLIKLILAAILENFGYRQLHTWWRFTGIIDYLRKKQSWGGMVRKGFNKG
ncbi:glycosyltransferase family 2 protein [Chloroflexota bacterium]